MPSIRVIEGRIAITTVATNSAYIPLGAIADTCAATMPGNALTYVVTMPDNAHTCADTTGANGTAAGITITEQARRCGWIAERLDYHQWASSAVMTGRLGNPDS
jgi:hypothetical protein